MHRLSSPDLTGPACPARQHTQTSTFGKIAKAGWMWPDSRSRRDGCRLFSFCLAHLGFDNEKPQTLSFFIKQGPDRPGRVIHNSHPAQLAATLGGSGGVRLRGERGGRVGLCPLSRRSECCKAGSRVRLERAFFFFVTRSDTPQCKGGRRVAAPQKAHASLMVTTKEEWS